ncbi:MAG: hypothetical protein IAE64_04630 [Flavobacteriales bacterium]|nr:hypothetical protein [Flavobacteriales bacterium]
MIRLIICVAVVLATLPSNGRSEDYFEKAKASASVSDYVEAGRLIRLAVSEKPKDEEVLELATRIYTELEILDTAVLYGRRLYEQNASTPSAVRTYATALIRAGNPTEAVRILRKITQKNADVETSLSLVEALVEADSIQAAELVATTAKKNYPKSPDAYLAVGLLYMKYKPQPVYELAKDNLEKTIELEENNLDAHFALAQVYWRMANRESDQDLSNELFKRCLLEWNKVGQLDPRSARAWFEQGKILYLAKKFRESVGALQRYKELRPGKTGNSITNWYLGDAFFELHLFDSATVYLNQVIESIDTLKPNAYMMLGKCGVYSKDWSAAVNSYNQAVTAGRSLNQWEPTDLWYFGTALVMAGDTSKAISVMTEASQKEPGNCSFMFRFGLLLSGKNMREHSNQIFRQRLLNCSDSLDAKVYLFLGNNFYADSVLDSARVYYEKSVNLDPAPYTLNRLAETFTALADEQQARTIYERVITAGAAPGASTADKQGAVQAILRLNGFDLTAKNFDAIITRSKAGLEIDGKNQWLNLYLAIGYQGSGDTNAACKWYKEVLKIDSNNDTARKNLKALGC